MSEEIDTSQKWDWEKWLDEVPTKEEKKQMKDAVDNWFKNHNQVHVDVPSIKDLMAEVIDDLGKENPHWEKLPLAYPKIKAKKIVKLYDMVRYARMAFLSKKKGKIVDKQPVFHLPKKSTKPPKRPFQALREEILKKPEPEPQPVEPEPPTEKSPWVRTSNYLRGAEIIIPEFGLRHEFYAYQQRPYKIITPCHNTCFIPRTEDVEMGIQHARLYCHHHSIYWRLDNLARKLDYLIQDAVQVKKEFAACLKRAEEEGMLADAEEESAENPEK